MRRKLWTGILSALALLVLILDTKKAILGAAEGLSLCISTIIPSLLPFFVLSILLTSSLIGEKAGFLRPIGKLCGIPRGAESLFIVGALGGYPAGAGCIVSAYQDGSIRKLDAQRMLAFCNLAGPAFLFGVIADKFSTPFTVWGLWGIHILSAIFVGMLLPNKTRDTATLRPRKQSSLPDALQRSLRIMASVCGWIILFRIIIAFLQRWLLWLLPTPLKVCIIGTLELSNGCLELGSIRNEGLRFILSSGMLAFGGLCVSMQTVSVCNGLALKTYFIGKILQVIFSVLLAITLQYAIFPREQWQVISVIFWFIPAAAIILCLKFLHKKQKTVAISCR